MTVAVLTEALRVLFPLLYDFAEEIGFATAAGVVPLVFVAPFAAALGRSFLGPRGLLAVTAGGLFACRLAIQLVAPGLLLAATGSMLGFAAIGSLVDVLRSEPASVRPDGRGFAGAVLAGLLLDTTIRLTFATWDVAWQSGPWPWAACLGLLVPGTAALAACLRRPVPAIRTHEVDSAAPGRGWTPPQSGLTLAAFGAFLALELLVFASPALVASSTGMGLAVAGGAVLVGFALSFGGLATARPARWPRVQPLLWGAGLACWAALAILGLRPPEPSEPLLLGVIVIGQVWAVSLLALAMRPPLTSPAAPIGRGGLAGWTRGGWRTSIAAGLASILFIAVLLPYQIHYELPLPMSNWVLPVAAALLLGLAAARGARWPRGVRGPRLAFAGTAAALALLAVPLGLGLTAPSGAEASAGERSFRLVSYNIHQAVNVSGHLDPAAIARVIERQDADIVLLQEVGRGWPLSGTMDVGTWLARRLDMRLVYGPAADHQFGNAVLTDLPVTASRRGRLPQGNGSMLRGYVAATVDIGRAEVEVWSTHLQHQDHTTRTRIAEIETLLEAWGGRSPAVITGDMNARPGSPEMREWFENTNLRSAQDVSGNPAEPTCCWPRIDHRIDWILGTPGLRFTDFEIARTKASDHLPLAVTVHIPREQ